MSRSRKGSKDNPHLNPCTDLPFHLIVYEAAAMQVRASLRNQNTLNYTIRLNTANNLQAQTLKEFIETHSSGSLAIVLDRQVVSILPIDTNLFSNDEIVGSFNWGTEGVIPLKLLDGLPIELTVKNVNGTGHSILITLAAQPNTPTDQVEKVLEIIRFRLRGSGLLVPTRMGITMDDRIFIEIMDDHLDLDIDMIDIDMIIKLIVQLRRLEFVDFSKIYSCEENMPVEGDYIIAA